MPKLLWPARGPRAHVVSGRRALSAASPCRRDQEGAEIAEAAMVLPILFLILFMIVWLTLTMNSLATLQRAAKEAVNTAARPTCASCGDTFDSNTQVVNAIDQVLQADHLNPRNVVANAPAFACTATPAPTCTTVRRVQICTGVPLTCGSATCQTPPAACGSNPLLGMRVSFGYRFNSPVPVRSWRTITIPASAQAQVEN